ncbi:MAG: hypothetical protein GY715_10665 [Planctomycetes bacterium]|nr:hypothetical protein [Planctomycetota bacterium]
MELHEKLGSFYLGRGYDADAGEVTDRPTLYDARDLTTHAVCVGMTGSGKTGLCVSLLEEAAIDGVPAIAIDPKGDLGNLLLTFPALRAEDFRPWIDEREAQRKGMSVDDYAANRADLWRNGLAKWGQDGARIQRFRDAVDIAIYTPGSSAGLPLTVLRSFAAPPAELAADTEALRERVATSVSGLLALLDIDADPVRSREHILLSTILDRAWRAGRDMDVAAGTSATATPIATAPSPRPAVAAPADDGLLPQPPPLPAEIIQRYLPVTSSLHEGETLVYRPALAAIGRLHYVRTSAGVDDWVDVSMLADIDGDAPRDPWEDAETLARAEPALARQPDTRGRFTRVPAKAMRAASYRSWSKRFVDHLYRNREVTLLKCADLKRYSKPDEPEREFRIRLRDLLHERRDERVEKLRRKYASKITTLQDRIRRAEARVDREKAQYKQAGFQTAISLGTTVLGVLFGRKKASVGNVGRAATTARGAGRTSRERGDVGRAKENVEALGRRLADLESEVEEEVERVHEDHTVDDLDFEEITLRPTKSHTSVRTLALVWAPYRVGAGGIAEPLFEL